MTGCCLSWLRKKRGAAMKLVVKEKFVKKKTSKKQDEKPRPQSVIVQGDNNGSNQSSIAEAREINVSSNQSSTFEAREMTIVKKNGGDTLVAAAGSSRFSTCKVNSRSVKAPMDDHHSSSSSSSSDFSVNELSLDERKGIAETFERLVELKDHWYRARKYPDTFVGREAVNVLLHNKIATSRSQAVEIGQMLARDFNLLEHVHRDHDFKDEYLFYRFVNKRLRFLQVGDEIAALTVIGNAMVGNNRDSFSSSSQGDLPKQSLSEIAKAFEEGIVLGDNTYHHRAYKQTFVGSQAVDFMIEKGMAYSRKSAVELGQALQDELNLFQHVHKQHFFKDQYLFYRFSPKRERPLPQAIKMSLGDVAMEFEKGIEVKDHCFRLHCYPDTFVAGKAVDFLLRKSIAKSRSDAVRIGQALQDRFNLFQHVSGNRKFSDDHLFFRFTDNSQRQLQSQCSFDVNESSSTTKDLGQVADAFRRGVHVKSHRYRLKTYKHTFIGSEAVDFIVNSSLAPSRKEAVRLGRALAKEFNLFVHVTASHEFSDDYLFYRFVDQDDSSHGSSILTESSRESIMLPEKMAQALRDGGVEIKDRKYRLKTYKKCFLGNEAVDFLVASKFAESREEAVELGRSLAREFDLFEHVTRDHELEDAPLFYRFVNLGDIRPLGTSALSLGTSKLREIARALESGVQVSVHRYRLRIYNDTFLGSEAVDFLVRSGFAATRQEAVYIGRVLADKFNLFEHVTHDHMLCDADIFFRFVKESLRTLWDESSDEETIVPIPSFGVVSADDQWRKRVQAFEVKMMSKQGSSSSIAVANRIDTTLRLKCWAREFRRLDPRYQILKYFHDVAQDGAAKIEECGINPDLLRPLLRYFSRASVFTVFRPTSFPAIRRMILGQAVGKGLDIKGKSAKRGKLSGFVPFLQISENRHKQKIRTLPKDGMVRLFFCENARRGRDLVAEKLEAIAEEMIETVQMAKGVLLATDGSNDDETRQDAMQSMLLDMSNPSISYIEDYAPKCYGLEIPVRLFWEAYIVRQDISRKAGSEYDTGRPSQPAFQDMNFAALRRPPIDGEPRAVLYHYAGRDDPMCPFNLLMAYEEQEQDRVIPVVSDFDCFLVGTRGVSFSAPLPKDQLEVLNWCVCNIETILDTQSQQCGNWTSRWLEVLKEASQNGFRPDIPKYGFGDPKTYSLMEQAIARLKRQGAVRHGSECFNYYFPQDLDEEFLVISDKLLDQNLPWKYVGVEGLQKILLEKIAEGYTFPLNPKWILCDPGWKKIYDQLLASEKPHVQDSLNVWYPKDSGLRKQIEAVHKRHPYGFQRFTVDGSQIQDERSSGTTSMDLALQNLKEGSLRSQFGHVNTTIQEET